jgi:hypothetical protein
MDPFRAEEAELVFRKPVEVGAVQIVEIDTDSLKVRKMKALADRSTKATEALLIGVEFGRITPRLPLRPAVVVVEDAEAITAAGITELDAGCDDERVTRDAEVGRGVVGAAVGLM